MESLVFDVRHRYDDRGIGIELPIRLSAASNRGVRLTAKVDTGASFCIFERVYAEQLGLIVEGGLVERVSTATGSFTAYGHSLQLSCLGWQYECTVYFAECESFDRNVLGRAGWLQHFRIGIVDYESTLYLAKYGD